MSVSWYHRNDSKSLALNLNQLAQLETCDCGVIRLYHIGDRCYFSPLKFKATHDTSVDWRIIRVHLSWSANHDTTDRRRFANDPDYYLRREREYHFADTLLKDLARFK